MCGVPSLKVVQDFKRNQTRRLGKACTGPAPGAVQGDASPAKQAVSPTSSLVCNETLDSPAMGGELERVEDVRNFARSIELPDTFEEIERGRMYAVPMKYGNYPNTQAIVLTDWKAVNWMRQLCTTIKLKVVRHADGKHKVHHGGWLLLPVGTHCLTVQKKRYRHSFRPLVYQFSRQVESCESVQMAREARDAYRTP